MTNNLIINSRNFVKNNLVLCLAIGIIIGFFLGYFVGIEVGQDTIRKQELKNLEQRINELETPEIDFSQISKDDDPILGNPNAPISIIEFSDYQCSFCARFYSDTLPLLKAEYIETGKVNLVFRDFPIQKIHPNAMPAAIASECADDQGKFWQYHDMLFENQSTWKKFKLDLAISTFKQFATELNLEQEVFDSCLNSDKHFDEVSLDLTDGHSYAVSGTPTFFVGNEKLNYTSMFGAQSFSDFRIIIDEKLNQ